MQWVYRLEQALDKGQFALHWQRITPLGDETGGLHGEIWLCRGKDQGARETAACVSGHESRARPAGSPSGDATLAFACRLMTVFGSVIKPGCNFDGYVIHVRKLRNLGFGRRVAA